MEKITLTDEDLPFVSIIIPVYMDWIRIKHCLQSLEKQTYPSKLYEVIVVDNQGYSELSFISNFAHARIIKEPTIGSYSARNAGIVHSLGTIIGFTDSDCIPSASWIEEGVKGLLNSPTYLALGGEIELFYYNKNSLTAVELYDSVYAFPQEKYIKTSNYSVTANLFTYKRCFEIVGLFDSRLFSGGDLEWGRRAVKHNIRFNYWPRAVVMHPARRTLKELLTKIRRLKGGKYNLPQKRGKFNLVNTLKILIFHIIPPIPKIYQMAKYHDEYSISQKIKISSIIILVHYYSLYEMNKLKIKGFFRKCNP